MGGTGGGGGRRPIIACLLLRVWDREGDVKKTVSNTKQGPGQRAGRGWWKEGISWLQTAMFHLLSPFTPFHPAACTHRPETSHLPHLFTPLRSGNVLPGTVVDNAMIDPFAFEYLLNSHAGIIGTNRVPKYTVLVDEYGFTSDAMQIFTHWLCHTYSLCHRWVVEGRVGARGPEGWEASGEG